MFELFNPRQEYNVRRGVLPHWYQPGVTYFVTYRTADSVPRELQRAWYLSREEWLQRNGFDPRVPDWQRQLRGDSKLAAEYDRRFVQRFLEYLDRGMGNCALAQSHIAQIVADNLRHFDHERYHLGDFVVMPNHVHLLVCLLGETDLQAQCASWKRYTSTEINRALKRRGRFWQAESFDHLVRTPEQFENFQIYIAENPRKARLQHGEYLYSKGPT